MSEPNLHVKQLPLSDYESVWQDMKTFTENRSAETNDEIWLVQHPPVFTQGQAGKAEHVLAPHDIPVIQTDRGGQVTYHGPGQIVAYLLIDIRRLKIGARQLVTNIEQSIVNVLKGYGIESYPKKDAPGVYVEDAKIAALGLRIRKGCSYHGLSLNVDMDLTPFGYINPCGYQGLAVTQMKDLNEQVSLDSINEISKKLCDELKSALNPN